MSPSRRVREGGESTRRLSDGFGSFDRSLACAKVRATRMAGRLVQ
jgi:hypothetical protein